MERRVAVIMSAGRADAFATAVRRVGCVPVLVSPFRDETVEGGAEVLAAALSEPSHWVAVTSPRAAPMLMPHVADLSSRKVRIAAVGPGTAWSLRSVGVEPAVVGGHGGAELGRLMLEAGLESGQRVVHPCGEHTYPELAGAMRSAGVELVAVAVYRMVPDPVGERFAQDSFAAAVIGSPRLAERALDLLPSRPPVVAVGRTTASAMRDLGWPPDVVAASPTPEDVAGALGRLLN